MRLPESKSILLLRQFLIDPLVIDVREKAHLVDANEKKAIQVGR